MFHMEHPPIFYEKLHLQIFYKFFGNLTLGFYKYFPYAEI